MNKDDINDISEIISSKIEEIYNTAITMANLRLLNNYKDGIKEWQSKQRRDITALEKDVSNLVKKEIKPLFSNIEKALLLAYALSRSNSTNKSLTDEELKDIREEIKQTKNERFDRQLKALQTETAKTLNKLPNIVGQMQKKNINQVGASYSLMKEKEINELYVGITKQTTKGMENAPKITYKNKRQVPFTAYADMKTRTLMQEYTNKAQTDAGRNAGLVFWLVSSFGDSAKDHVDYQGQIYVDREWESIIQDEETRQQVQEYISANGTRIKQDVEEGEPYLTTRPNCRHTWRPMNTEEILGGKSTNKLLKENNMLLNGDYESAKAKARDKLRYEERQIRKYKQDLEQKKIELERTPTGAEKDYLQKELSSIKHDITKHQRNAKQLVDNNSQFLERSYVRENPRLIQRDLGVKYHTKYYKS